MPPTCQPSALGICRRATAASALLLLLAGTFPWSATAAPAMPREVDPARAESLGVRRLAGKHLVLFTDLPSDPAVDELPAVFDQAYPIWCEFFKQPPIETWQMVGYLMQDKARFEALGLMPERMPSFEHGYSTEREFWLFEQPSPYFRRHLLLHEGTHLFMFTRLGDVGPPWYAEGLAELLATHRWVDGRLTMGIFPASREELPRWGRIRLVRDAVRRGDRLTLAELSQLRYEDFSTDSYAWCWAAATFLNGNPHYRRDFRHLSDLVARAGVPAAFDRLRAANEPRLETEWRMFTDQLDYGEDIARAAIEFAPGQPLPTGGAQAKVTANRGWQSTGVEVEAGKRYHLSASGQFTLARLPRPWVSEANGISIHYYRGRPLGLLLAAIWSADDPGDPPFAPLVIGTGTELEAPRSGTLYLRVNDSPAGLADNEGELEVQIEAR